MTSTPRLEKDATTARPGPVDDVPVEKVAPRRRDGGERLQRIAIALLWRVAAALVTLLIALTIAFALGRLSGDPTTNILGPMAPQEQRDALRAQLGLDQPIITQYLEYLRGVVTLDLGTSLQFYQPNTQMISDRLPFTLQLVAAGMVLAVLVGVPLGVLAATREGTWWDRASSALALLGQSVPVFWLGMMLVLLFAVKWGLLPAGQSGSLKHLVLPAVTMSLYPMAHVARLTRATMSEVLREPFIDAARARGLSVRSVVWRHGFGNACLPVLTIVVLQTGTLLSGAVAVEYVYSWPGLGQLALQAIQFRDFPLVQAIVVFAAIVFVVLNQVVDALHAVIDPRTR